MSLFFVFFFSLYSLIHLYVFVKARNALAMSAGASIVVVCFMLLMIGAPILVRFSENAGLEALARIVAYTGYTWLGILFLLVCSLILTDVYRLFVHVAGAIPGVDVSRFSFSARFCFLVAVSCSLLVGIYGYFEARHVRLERVVVKSSKLPARVSPLRIAQVSDVHIGLIVRHERLTRIIDQVRRADPHILVSTGDLVDGQINSLEGLAELFQGVSPQYGKFAITGNHEFYAGLDQAVEFTKRSGFTVLRGESTPVEDFMTIVGVDDPAGSGVSKGDGAKERALLGAAPSSHPQRFRLLLKHRPDVERESLGLFDLQLSGHVHRGQIFPFRFFTRLFYPHIYGLLRLEKNANLYVSAGSGTWGPPIRFLAPPEVTLIEIVHGE